MPDQDVYVCVPCVCVWMCICIGVHVYMCICVHVYRCSIYFAGSSLLKLSGLGTSGILCNLLSCWGIIVLLVLYPMTIHLPIWSLTTS